MKGKRILITGGLGFIGSNIAHRCVAQGAQVTIFDCLDPKSGGNMKNIEEIEEDVNIVFDDIRNLAGISSAVRKQDIIFHCAAYTSHPESMKDPVTDIEVNCIGTINILEAARRFNPKTTIVHIGTTTQVGKMRKSIIDEEHPEFPTDIYSASKVAAEKYVLIYGNAYDIKTTVVRLANVYGPRSNIRSPDFGFINYFIGLALQGKELPVFGAGNQKRNVLFITDAVRALLAASISSKSRRHVLFAVSDKHYTAREIAEGIARVFSVKVRKVPWPKNRQAIEIGDAVISNKKIKQLLNWRPSETLLSGLEKTRKFYAGRLNKYL